MKRYPLVRYDPAKTVALFGTALCLAIGGAVVSWIGGGIAGVLGPRFRVAVVVIAALGGLAGLLFLATIALARFELITVLSPTRVKHLPGVIHPWIPSLRARLVVSLDLAHATLTTWTTGDGGRLRWFRLEAGDTRLEVAASSRLVRNDWPDRWERLPSVLDEWTAGV